MLYQFCIHIYSADIYSAYDAPVLISRLYHTARAGLPNAKSDNDCLEPSAISRVSPSLTLTT